ncbi:MAG: sigma-70 family RNA polymerase sigma factor [Victivallales bacterium]|nr:sigma-70 family RNA polymerase sigma factor [Victivallales bacterium]
MGTLSLHPEQIAVPQADQGCGMAVVRDYENVTDKVLLGWMCDGDGKALEQIVSRYNSRIVAYSTRFLNSPDLAKDVCQEVFLKLIDKPPAVLLYDNLGPWLFRVARNLSIDKRRRRKVEVTEDDLPEAPAEGTPLTEATANNDLAVMRELVRKLPEEIRDVVELRIYGRVPFKDIAVILNIPQGTALWRMHRALELLRMGWKQL